jgi:hypothetical protein
MTFEKAGGGRETCGHYARIEILETLDGEQVGSDLVTNSRLQTGDRYVVAILDMRGRMPEIVDDPSIPADDLGFSRCRARWEQYSLGSARVVGGPNSTDWLIDRESTELVPEDLRGDLDGGVLRLSQLREAILAIRAVPSGN